MWLMFCFFPSFPCVLSFSTICCLTKHKNSCGKVDERVLLWGKQLHIFCFVCLLCSPLSGVAPPFKRPLKIKRSRVKFRGREGAENKFEDAHSLNKLIPCHNACPINLYFPAEALWRGWLIAAASVRAITALYREESQTLNQRRTSHLERLVF